MSLPPCFDYSKPPFSATHELNSGLSGKIPLDLHDIATRINVAGNPRSLSSPLGPVPKFLSDELRTVDLDILAPHLWLMTTQSSDNISPLHHQLIKGRKTVITESPRLHLLWIHDRIFLKPLPPYLLSHAFWEHYLLPGCSPHPLGASYDILLKSALGYIRTYSYLIAHPSDFKIALDSGLLPPGTTFEGFCLFAQRFLYIPDNVVSARYHFGEIRLTRLNFWSKFFLRRWHYETTQRQYGPYFERFYGPLLFLFGALSVSLSAMQVELAVEPLSQKQWHAFWNFSRYFSVLSLAIILFLSILVACLLIGKVLMEFLYATKDKRRLNRTGN